MDNEPTHTPSTILILVRQSSKSPNAKPERQYECVEVKTVSPIHLCYYNKICIFCIAWLAWNVN